MEPRHSIDPVAIVKREVGSIWFGNSFGRFGFRGLGFRVYGFRFGFGFRLDFKVLGARVGLGSRGVGGGGRESCRRSCG